MGIPYNAKDAESCWPEGDYDAVLNSSEDTVSKTSGADMEVWQIGVFHPDGRDQTIKEYVTASAAFKIKQLATALGRKADFEAGTFHAEDYIGASFTVALSVESQDGYDDKNRVAKFKAKAQKVSPPPARPAPTRAPATIGAGVREKMAAKPAATQPFGETQEFKDDDIPF
jgi:hypothetical protein